MPIIDLHRSEFDAGTQTKLEIFEKYLEAWLPTFINSPRCESVNICDFFAGPGKDPNGNPGSPLIIIDVINRFADSIKKKRLKINILFNELDYNKYVSLVSAVKLKMQEKPETRELIKTRIENEDFEQLYTNIRLEMLNECNLFFIDQNGIKHMTPNRIIDLENFVRTDYIFFSASSYLNRFDFKNYFPDLQIGEDVKSHDVHRQLCEYYQKILGPNGKTLLYPFTIKKINIYGLIFGSKHIFGADKFLRIAWAQNALNGEANFDIDKDEGPIQLNLFDSPKIKKVDQFKLDLKEWIFTRRQVTNKDVYLYTIKRGFLPKFASEALKELKLDNKIEHFSYPLISYENTIRNHKCITFKVI